ncbi:unnamed protein product [Ilex paraguariensis]|uniref:protein disulfide-isomerase n=1 Tax=Ilex paraguariensis TaxID=185542 RepID=A0ABC8RTT1_9AQUA
MRQQAMALCGHCKKLAPEYEKAASTLSGHDPPVILAKVDANEEKNKVLASEYEVQEMEEEYSRLQGPRDADGIVSYLKKQSGPASVELKSAEDANGLVDDKKIVVVGIFPALSGENLRILPLLLRIALFKPFDELFVDFQDFDVDALEKFVEEGSIQLLLSLTMTLATILSLSNSLTVLMQRPCCF